MIVSQIADRHKNIGFVKIALRPIRIERFNPIGENDFIDVYSEFISILNIRQKSLLDPMYVQGNNTKE